MAKLTTAVEFTHPLAHVIVKVTFSRGFWVRLWLCRMLVGLAVWIGGGELEVQE